MCGVRCAKYLLFVFNFFFWLSGLAVLGIGIWTKIDAGQFDSFLGYAGYSISAYILIAAGAFVAFVGFVGCCGAIRENRCMLGTFFVLLLLIFCAEAVAGILGFIYRDRVETEIKKELDDQILNKYGVANDVDLNNNIDVLQQRLKCCGGTNKYYDWMNSKWHKEQNPTKRVPLSCCIEGANTTSCYRDATYKEVHPKGCYTELKSYVDKHMILIGAIAAGISVIQLLGMVFACCLYCSVDD
ncbi:CD151 antigen [Exaiptasia diaphana]|uniref:Tetraspanin n=1 Tax=Exaiptasia diaphana TaxID=2652724 RepID=A0A913Y293_EXADI|nr:CD151 antigen [Exaiptasia diaphana]KXJ23241.1 Tetraspanin-11 [Exaiptasia diaphana]